MGGWQGRVRFAPGGAFAYRPDEILVHAPMAAQAESRLRQGPPSPGAPTGYARGAPPGAPATQPILGGRFARLTNVPDPLQAVAALREVGLPAQVNHVLFATCCCPPHPATPEAAAYYANPKYANFLAANPELASPLFATPKYANPYYVDTSRACCCGTRWWDDPLHAAPKYANAVASPFVRPEFQASGRRRNTARPTGQPAVQADAVIGQSGDPVRVAILDTGWAQQYAPALFANMNLQANGFEVPDADGDGYLDPAAGHGTFISGVVAQVAPGCLLEVFDPVRPEGDVDEEAVATILLQLAGRQNPPDLVNLSFGGYSLTGMDVLADAIAALRDKGTVVVASAGNDGTCAPMYPAALSDVVGVGALDTDGTPAPFTNYGPWVDACAPGVDMVSLFFQFNGAEPVVDGVDLDDFVGKQALWSGTSFAAPYVLGKLARLVQTGTSPQAAVTALVTNGATKLAMLGTVVS